MRRVLSGFLLLALLLAALPPAARAAFSDVTDPVTAEQTEILRALGIVGGVGGGLFRPEGTFNRASFCKMALIAMNREGEAALQATRVIFSDVKADHWALGFVNAAASVPPGGGAALVRGTGAGLFEPDKPITFGEAVTILMRVLGYTESDVATAGAWYAGFLLRAGTIGLTNGIARGGEETLTRAEAAALFYNLLFIPAKGKTDIYLTDILGGSVVKNTIILTTDERAVRTMAGSYPITRSALSGGMEGVPLDLYLDRDGRVLTVRPLPDMTSRSVRIAVAEGRYLVTDSDERIPIAGNTPVLRTDGEQTTYSAIYLDLPAGSSAVLCYDEVGQLRYLYLLGTGRNTTSMAAKTVYDLSFSTLVGVNPTRLTVYKNGASATLADAQLYDVGTYDADAATLYLSDRRLTGVYENLYPSPTSPETITVMGATFPVLDSAVADLARFRPGDGITLLLTGDNKVAGAVSPDAARGTAVGLVTLDGNTASVALTFGVTVSGTVNLQADLARTIVGKLVRVNAPQAGRLSLWPVDLAEVTGTWNVAGGTLGERNVARGVSIYERVGDGRLYAVEKSAVSLASVPATQILYAGIGSNGEVDNLILDDVTGDGYVYGFARVYSTTGGDGGMSTENVMLSITNKKQTVTLMANGNILDYNDKPAGAGASLALRGGETLLSRALVLTAVKDIPRAAFQDGYVLIGGTRYPLASNLDDHCYNAFAKVWFPNLAAARAYSGTLTVYYDKSPAQGGKIRMVVAE